jgi:hypothetical protein
MLFFFRIIESCYNQVVDYGDLIRKLNDAPLRPFRIKLSNSTTIDVLEPGAVIVGETSAVLPVEWGVDERKYRIALNWKTISIDHIVEFQELNPPRSNEKRKRA